VLNHLLEFLVLILLDEGTLQQIKGYFEVEGVIKFVVGMPETIIFQVAVSRFILILEIGVVILRKLRHLMEIVLFFLLLLLFLFLLGLLAKVFGDIYLFFCLGTHNFDLLLPLLLEVED